jgi:hypothetical protein
VPACDDMMLHAGTYDHASMIRNTGPASCLSQKKRPAFTKSAPA